MADNSSWPRDASGYTLDGLIGAGGFGQVYRGVCKTNNQIVAIKVIEMDSLTASLDDIQKEIRTMNLCVHPNLVTYHACFVNKSDLWIVMPYMSLGSCHRVLLELKKSGTAFKEEWIAAIMNQVGQGLAYLHGRGIVHRDVKSSNILIGGNGEVMIADFGVAGMFDKGAKSKEKCKTFVGTPCWMAPEVIEHTRYTENSDIWSFGITLLELAKGYAPYAKEPPMKALLKTLQEAPPSLKSYPNESNFSPYFEECYSKCLVKDPNRRPAINVINDTRFLSKANLSCLSELAKSVVPLELDDTISKVRPGVTNVESVDGNIMVTDDSGKKQFVPGTSWAFDISKDDDDDDVDMGKMSI